MVSYFDSSDEISILGGKLKRHPESYIGISPKEISEILATKELFLIDLHDTIFLLTLGMKNPIIRKGLNEFFSFYKSKGIKMGLHSDAHLSKNLKDFLVKYLSEAKYFDFFFWERSLSKYRKERKEHILE